MKPYNIIFLRRQSPDWGSLSEDYRHGVNINADRYIPTHLIPAFPRHVDRLIEQWNSRFNIDFFSFRYVLSSLSQKSLASVPNSYRLFFEDIGAIGNYTENSDAYVYFHDDDDFFAPYLSSVICHFIPQPDVIVTPLFRIGTDTFTYVREGLIPDYVLGRCKLHDFRYQTNNYGINSRHCLLLNNCFALKDHIWASYFADQCRFHDLILPTVLSATVKTPGSALMLPQIFINEEILRNTFEQFIKSLSQIDLPEEYNWLAVPISKIIRLVQSVYAGHGYCKIEDLIPTS